MAASSPRDDELAAHYAICGAELRAKDRDLWLAALYAPAPLRKHLHAIYAFTLEVGEIAPKVSQPMLGEMRLRWWVDAILDAAGGARAHPTADALLDTIDAKGLDREEFADLLEARSADLYDHPLESTGALLEYCRRVATRPLLWSARCLGAADSANSRRALELAGVAMGLIDAAGGLSVGRGGQFALPDEADLEGAGSGAVARALATLAHDRYSLARELAKTLDEPSRVALLPAARLPLYIEQLRAGGREPSPWRRQWRLWRAARNGI